ncbi:MAG: DUF1844 domain-containing protein [Bdellovibrionaceae bacterium]|nr:DUF1844 domain-containing protein [Pseudobdellovibrionaceae bacterium]
MTSEIPQRVEASFSTLLYSLGSAAAMSLGLAPNPQTNKTEINLTVAQFNIDMLEVLEKKTTGNLSKEETDFLKHLLADLRMKYVEIAGQQKK